MTEPTPAVTPVTNQVPRSCLGSVHKAAPWAVYLFVFLVVTSVGFLAIRYFMADDSMAVIFASVTCGFIVCACMCFWISLRKSNESVILRNAAEQRRLRRQRRKVTVTLHAQVYTGDMRKGERTDQIADDGDHSHSCSLDDPSSPSSATPSESQMCPICLVDFEPGTKIVKLDCEHVFHLECIASWVTRKAQCPACRFNVPTVSRPVSGRTTPNEIV